MTNPFAALAEEYPRPKTPTDKIMELLTPQSPRKKARAKRRTMSPLPKEKLENEAKSQKSATECLFLAKEALYAAIEAEKLALGESYIVDNDI